MKKLFALTAIFALVFTTCEQSEQPTTLQNLTIRNESSYLLTNVKFSGITFAVSGSAEFELPVSTQAVKQVTEDIAKQAGYITFTRKDKDSEIHLRTATSISFPDRGYIFVFTDHTAVQEQTNTGNQGTLATISFLSQVTVEHGGLSVAKNDVVNLGESVVNNIRQAEFILKNTGSGTLILTGNEPIKISDAEENIFTVVKPSSSEIAADSSLTFRINFNPKNIQNYTAKVTISSNDHDGDFAFIVTAKGTPSKPIATVSYAGDEISQNGTINAGEVLITQSKNITVTIKNEGTDLLTLDTANIMISGDDEGAFSRVSTPGSNISVGSESLFIIKCEPAKIGENQATLIIPTNDSSRNPINVYLQITAIMAYAVSFDANGGVPEPDPQAIRQGEKVIEPETITKIGYTFDGWYREAAFANKWNFAGDTVMGAITLYAKWTPIPINVQVASVTDSSVGLAWNAISGVGGYHVYRSDSEDGIYERINAAVITGTTFTDTGLNATTDYYYKVIAVIGGVEDLQSNIVSATSAIGVPGSGLAEKLAWLTANAESAGSYFIEIDKDETIAPQSLSYSGKTDVTITLTGKGQVRTVQLSANGSLFVVGSGIKLILDKNITLNGRNSNNGLLVGIGNGGTLVMNEGAKITGNTYSNGGGVRVNGGTFTMNGGEISGNTSSSHYSNGGGVRVDNSGTFTMNGGEISGNTSPNSFGGGVYVENGTFTMNGGKVSGNTSFSGGGGVYMSGTFTMNGGEISGNTVSNYGGGVYIDIGTFIMTAGVIYGSNAIPGLRNTASSGAALYGRYGSGEYGRCTGTVFSKTGNLTTTDTTIRIVDGVLLTE